MDVLANVAGFKNIQALSMAADEISIKDATCGRACPLMCSVSPARKCLKPLGALWRRWNQMHQKCGISFSFASFSYTFHCVFATSFIASSALSAILYLRWSSLCPQRVLMRRNTSGNISRLYKLFFGVSCTCRSFTILTWANFDLDWSSQTSSL